MEQAACVGVGAQAQPAGLPGNRRCLRSASGLLGRELWVPTLTLCLRRRCQQMEQGQCPSGLRGRVGGGRVRVPGPQLCSLWGDKEPGADPPQHLAR